MSKTAIPEATRGSYFNIDPSLCAVITDPNHLLFDERALFPPDEGLIASLAAHGNIEPILVRPNGGQYEVVVGRRRVKAATVVNERRAKEGKEPLLLKALVQRGSDSELYAIVMAENSNRLDDPPTLQAIKIFRGLQMGCSEAQIASAIGVSTQTIKNRLRLLDCDKSVQVAVDSGKLAEMQARDLAALPRAEQKAALSKMLEEGATKGVKAKKVIDGAKKGNGQSDVNTGRVRSRKFLEDWKITVASAAYTSNTPGRLLLVEQVIDYILGDDNALEDAEVPTPTAKEERKATPKRKEARPIVHSESSEATLI